MLTGMCFGAGAHIPSRDSERGRTDKKVGERKREKKGCEKNWGKESEGGTKRKSERGYEFSSTSHGMNSMLPIRADLRA